MNAIDGERVRRSIDAAERGSTGRIAVRIAPGHTADALESARKHFERAGLHRHPERNAVIFLVAPKARKFAVFGDAAIDERVGEQFWRAIVDEMAPHFAQGHPTEGLVLGIERVGEELRRHFPSEAAVR